MIVNIGAKIFSYCIYIYYPVDWRRGIVYKHHHPEIQEGIHFMIMGQKYPFTPKTTLGRTRSGPNQRITTGRRANRITISKICKASGYGRSDYIRLSSALSKILYVT